MRAGQAPRADDPWVRGAAWLRDVYGGLVEPAVPPNREPVYETGAAWPPACRAVPQPGFPEEPMLAASVVVPKDGGTPFHLSPGDPLADLEAPGTAARRADGGAGHGRRVRRRGPYDRSRTGLSKGQSATFKQAELT
ncbi:hypothetical protein [Streptomyces sp. HF10]|uniref:hypothetical protein n=1 Tax=Streptomyces sp. HF10 TaxID=2692233 RepID=UPI00131866A6|nr:hypothetical protein [Streptomyces sp. HF10]QHC30895.1 hypothetical protein GR129_21020 [Streptomyces sp. HF10]